MSDKWTKLHVTKLWVKDGVRQKWCVTELWAKNAVCVSTMVYGKVGHDKVHVTKVCAQEGVCVCLSDKDMTEVAVGQTGENCV